MPDEFTTNVLMRSILGLRGRAERLEPDQVVETFSAVGPLLDLVSTDDHQVIFGRRGTGKTHALRYLYATNQDRGDCAIFVDMRNLGSDGSIYNDSNLPVTDRATRLLIDTLSFVQEGILEYALAHKTFDIGRLTLPFDRFSQAISQVRVTGDVQIKHEDTTAKRNEKGGGLAAAFGLGKANLDLSASASKTTSESTTDVREQSGREVLSIRFPDLSVTLRDIVNLLPAKRTWIILDEWSSIPQELQPFLADMLKRAFFNVPQITVKIGAIEHRTRFLYEPSSEVTIGLEITADIRSNVRLDDYLLFENNSDSSITFFKEFLYRHVKSYCKEKGYPEPDSVDEVYRKAFNQRNSFEEFVKSSEGVPRDALLIASNCAQKSMTGPIDIPTVRAAAHKHYQEDKSSQVDENPVLRDLLQFVVDHAIRKKKTNAFLLEVGHKDRNVDLLFDRRLVHIRQRNVSSRDNPGARYLHYKIDYGCYVDLIATKQMPSEYDFSILMPIEVIAETIEVPMEDDARSYRRSILDLDSFYRAHPQHSPIT